MKNLIVVLSVFFAFSTVASAQCVTKKEEQKIVYVCTMHPDETNSNGGKCAKCGIDMVKIAKKNDSHPLKGSQPTSKIVVKYVCPMGDSTSDEPGKCPKCGMEMTQKEDHKH
jgi:hypothetical protein